MPDTPRTRADLLADIFPDANAGDVSPQDMRDLVESIPVGGPGLERVAGFGMDPAIANYPTGMDVPDSTTTYIPWTAPGNPALAYDPNGWFQFDDDYPSPDWVGETVPAGSWALLPEGVYDVSSSASWDTNTTGRRSCYGLDTCDNRTPDTDPQLDPWAWDPLYALYNHVGVHQSATALAQFGTFAYQFTHATIRVTAATAPVAFASAVVQVSGGTRKLLGATVNVMQLSEKG